MDHSLAKKAMNVVRDLPALPPVVNRLNRLLDVSVPRVADLAQVISLDQSLSVKVLHLVNSAYCGVFNTDDLRKAIVHLGSRGVSQVVTTVSICDMFKDGIEGPFDRPEFWRHSVAAAVLSRMIASSSRHPRPDEAFTCGLLHDIGKAILDQYLHAEMTRVLRDARENRIPFIEAEKRTLVDVDHTIVGEMAAKAWRLPILFVGAIRHHHTPLGERKGALSDDVMVDIVRLADFLAHDLGIGDSGNGARPAWSDALLSRIRLDAATLEALRENCVQEIDRLARLYPTFSEMLFA